jgi:hypothetical protein
MSLGGRKWNMQDEVGGRAKGRWFGPVAASFHAQFV